MWDILDLAPFRVYVVDVLSREVVYANNHRQLEDARCDLKCHQMIYQEDRPCLSCKIPELVDATGRPNGRIVTSERFNEAEDHWYQLQEGTMSLSDGRTAMYSIAIDIGEIKEMQNNLAEAHAELAFKNQQLESLSATDRLTGLFNRRKIDEVLSQECARAQRTQLPLTVIMADIDKFKSVNDTHGHQVGDRLLVEFAEILRRRVRKVDTLGRWGGEEFMILCPDTNLPGACTVAENIRTAIENYDFPVVGRKTSCFGVAEYRPGEAPDAVIKRADDALYRAKNGGRNRVAMETDEAGESG
jgi:diguanylate cyclase (GGDEF)-like protein